MLFQQLPRLGRGSSPLALALGSFSTGARPQLPATTYARSGTVSRPDEHTASDYEETQRISQHQVRAAVSAATTQQHPASAALLGRTRGCAGEAAAAAGAARDACTVSRPALTGAVSPFAARGHATAAASVLDRWQVCPGANPSSKESLGNTRARGYAATAPPPRDPRFATLEESDLEAFRGMLGANNVLTDPTALQAVNKCVAVRALLCIQHCDGSPGAARSSWLACRRTNRGAAPLCGQL